MNRLIPINILVLITILTVQANAQPANQWLTPEARAKNFPASQYVSGFAMTSKQAGETAAATQERAGHEAAKIAAASIRTLIESESKMHTTEVEVNGDFQFVSQFAEYTRQSYNAEIAGLKTEFYTDPATNYVHAFAYALRTDLAAYYSSEVDMALKKVDDAIAQARIATKAGLKLKAKNMCTDALKPLARAEYAQGLLSAINPTNREDQQQNRCSQLKQELFQLLVDLEQSIYVYVQCSENVFGSPSTLLTNQIKNLLSQNQCSFCTDPEQADYQLKITATTRKHDVDNPNFKYSYADVQVELYSAYKRMVVFADELSVKGGATTHQTAARNAMKDAAPKVWKGIKPWILEK